MKAWSSKASERAWTRQRVTENFAAIDAGLQYIATAGNRPEMRDECSEIALLVSREIALLREMDACGATVGYSCSLVRQAVEHVSSFLRKDQFSDFGMLYQGLHTLGRASAIRSVASELQQRGSRAGTRSREEAVQRDRPLKASMVALLTAHPDVSGAVLARMAGNPGADRWARKIKAKHKAGTE